MADWLKGDPPVFVFGALRSGTTVFRLMLDAHGEIRNPGEADYLVDYLEPDAGHPTGYRYRIEALGDDRVFRAAALDIPPGRDGLDLLNDFLGQLAARKPGGVLTLNLHRHVDRVAEVLPQARIIHLLRDPRDVARSSIGMGWAGTLYHGVDHWIETEAGWDAVAGRLDPARVLELTYEALIRDTEGELRRVCDFLGVPYRDAMLSYHENTTYERPDIGLIEQWRRKSTPEEVAQVEARAGALMQRRGYALSGPVRPVAPLTRARLAVLDKARVWRFGVRRFGAACFFGEKMSRRLGMRQLSRQLRRAMDERQNAYLK